MHLFALKIKYTHMLNKQLNMIHQMNRPVTHPCFSKVEDNGNFRTVSNEFLGIPDNAFLPKELKKKE